MTMKSYMVVERFRNGCMDAVYKRFGEQGRLLPDGLLFMDSWLCRDREVCFQLMETETPALFEVWTSRWSDLVEFEIFELD